jgi:hypothetical protein
LKTAVVFTRMKILETLHQDNNNSCIFCTALRLSP